MIPLALFALTSCLAISPESSEIAAGDLAPIFPELAGESGSISAAPVPGVPRIFGIPELRRIAVHFHLSTDPSQAICFERQVAPLGPANLLAAMQRELPEGRLEILDFARLPAPQGRLEFPLAGLRRDGRDGFWSGFVRYGGGRSFAVWARVRVSVNEVRVVAAESIRPGPAIAAEQLRLETREVFPGESGYAKSIEPVAGRAARIQIPAGAPIRLDWLAPAQDVLRGDRVVVEVHSGAAHLRFEGTAEASGSAGAFVPVTNPASGRRFSARVEGKGRVSVGKGPS
jgi:flagella basal body P-ring formation protein FlgA